MKLFDKLRKNEFWGSVVKLSAGKLIGQCITIAATLILSRIYTDADYGTYGVITSLAAIITSAVGLALSSAIMVADTDEDSKRVFTVAFTAQTLLLLVVLLGMIALMPVKRFFDTSIPYVAAVGLMGLHIVLSNLTGMLGIYINKLKMNNVLFWNSLISSGCTVFISIPFGLFGFGFVGLLLAAIASEILCAVHMMRVAFPFIRIRSFGEVKKTFADCKRFILFQYPSNMMGTFSNNLPDQALYNSYGDAALGSYAMCKRIFNMPLHLIVAPIQTVYFRTAAQMKDRIKELADFTYDFLKKLALIAAIPMILCMAFGEYIFGFVLGWQWMEAGLIAAIMCPYFFLWFSYNCITYLRVTIGYQHVNLYTTIFQILSILVALVVSMAVDGGQIVTIAIFSGVNAFVSLMHIIVSFACMKRNYWKYLVFSLVYLAVCGGIAILLRSII